MDAIVKNEKGVKVYYDWLTPEELSVRTVTYKKVIEYDGLRWIVADTVETTWPDSSQISKKGLYEESSGAMAIDGNFGHPLKDYPKILVGKVTTAKEKGESSLWLLQRWRQKVKKELSLWEQSLIFGS